MHHFFLHAQAWWDAQRFDQPLWQVDAWRDQKVRHIHLHVAKALGKVVAALGEEGRTASGMNLRIRVRDEVLPDVAIYRSQLLNLFPDVGALSPLLAYHSASADVQEAEPLLRVVLGLSRASAQLAAYLEPREHGATSPVSHIRVAIENLHASAGSASRRLRGRSGLRAPGPPRSVTGGAAARVAPGRGRVWSVRGMLVSAEPGYRIGQRPRQVSADRCALPYLQSVEMAASDGTSWPEGKFAQVRQYGSPPLYCSCSVQCRFRPAVSQARSINSPSRKFHTRAVASLLPVTSQ